MYLTNEPITRAEAVWLARLAHRMMMKRVMNNDHSVGTRINRTNKLHWLRIANHLKTGVSV